MAAQVQRGECSWGKEDLFPHSLLTMDCVHRGVMTELRGSGVGETAKVQVQGPVCGAGSVYLGATEGIVLASESEARSAYLGRKPPKFLRSREHPGWESSFVPGAP